MIKARTAVMKSAHRNYVAMNWKGPSDWTFSRCLRLAHHEINGKRDAFVFAQLEREMRRLVKEREIGPTCRQAERQGSSCSRSTPPNHRAT